MASSSGSAKTFTFRASTSTKRRFDIAKFRDRVPAFEDTKSVSVTLAHKAARSDPDLVINTGAKRYEGSRESAGGLTQGSCYIAVRVDAQTGVMTAMPLTDMYSFKPAITYHTYDEKKAEELMAKMGNRKAMLEERLLAKKAHHAAGDDDDDDPDRPGLKAELVDDDDVFDDGAEPGWAAREDRDEDGNDGLDMEDEDLFDDDEDDGFGDDDDVALQERLHAKESAAEAASKRHGPGDGDSADEHEEKDDEDEEDGRAAPESEWGRRTKEDLRAERKRLRARIEANWDRHGVAWESRAGTGGWAAARLSPQTA